MLASSGKVGESDKHVNGGVRPRAMPWRAAVTADDLLAYVHGCLDRDWREQQLARIVELLAMRCVQLHTRAGISVHTVIPTWAAGLAILAA